MFRNLIIRVVVSLVLTVNILNCAFNTYNRFVPQKPVEHKVMEAPTGIPLVVHLWYWLSGWKKGSSSGSGKNPMPKPQP